MSFNSTQVERRSTPILGYYLHCAYDLIDTTIHHEVSYKRHDMDTLNDIWDLVDTTTHYEVSYKRHHMDTSKDIWTFEEFERYYSTSLFNILQYLKHATSLF